MLSTLYFECMLVKRLNDTKLRIKQQIVLDSNYYLGLQSWYN